MESEPHSHQHHDVLTEPDRRTFLDLMPYGVVLAEPDGAAIWVNCTWTQLTDQTEDDWQGHGWLDVCDIPDREARRNEIVAAARSGATYKVDWVVSADGHARRTISVHAVPELDRDQLVQIVVTAADVTDDRARSAHLLDQATHDSMTGLYNRAQFLEFLGHALDRRQRVRAGVAAVLFVDVDDLKAVNDEFGHAAGDQLLRDVAAHIKAGVRPSDIVARYGGDEFTILCEDLVEAGEADAIADRIRGAVHGDPPGNVSISIGIAIADDPDTEPQSIVAEADEAMYNTKRSNGDSFPDRKPKTSIRRNDRLMEESHDGFGLIALAAHELRTPLTTIAGFATTLRERRNSMEAADVDSALAIVERQAHQVCLMIDQLLERGRFRQDRPPLTAVDLAAVIADAIEAAPPPGHVSLTLTGDPPASPLIVTAERSRVTRVVVNLLTNAYRYGGPNIIINSHNGAATVTVAVEDDGPGVASGLGEAIFAPFVRGAVDVASPPRGSGLGLALAREIAESFGGHLTHERVRPHGACFLLKLPAADPSWR